MLRSCQGIDSILVLLLLNIYFVINNTDLFLRSSIKFLHVLNNALPFICSILTFFLDLESTSIYATSTAIIYIKCYDHRLDRSRLVIAKLSPRRYVHYYEC